MKDLKFYTVAVPETGNLLVTSSHHIRAENYFPKVLYMHKSLKVWFSTCKKKYEMLCQAAALINPIQDGLFRDFFVATHGWGGGVRGD